MGGRDSIVHRYKINNKIKPMNITEKKIFANRIMLMFNNNQQIRVSDVASLLYINKDKARRLLDWMVNQGYCKKKVIKYVGNANLNVYTRYGTVLASLQSK